MRLTRAKAPCWKWKWCVGGTEKGSEASGNTEIDRECGQEEAGEVGKGPSI